MPPATGLVLIKRFEYRDDPDEEWSNKYWFTGPIPANDTEWDAFATEIINSEKTCYRPSSVVTRAYGYNNSDEHSPTVWVKDYKLLGAEVPGTFPEIGSDPRFAGDQAGMISWRTSRRNARGKWIYLRKYMHDGTSILNDPDAVVITLVSAYTQHAIKLSNGTLTAGRRIRSAAQDETIVVGEGSSWVTTRTLKRRGKRPPAVAGP